MLYSVKLSKNEATIGPNVKKSNPRMAGAMKM
jgi:hypothetical protein